MDPTSSFTIDRRRALMGVGGLALGALAVPSGARAVGANRPVVAHHRQETTMPVNQPFTPENAAILLVDHQPGVLAMSASLPPEVVVRNTAILARLGEELDIPLVITSTRETIEFLGTNLAEIQEAAPKAYAARIARGGSLNAFADPRFLDAVATTGRKNLVIAGLLTDVCLYNTAVSAVGEGYTVLVVADASGTSTTLGDAVTYDRMRSMGIEAVTTYGILFELFNDLSTPEGMAAEAIAAASLAP